VQLLEYPAQTPTLKEDLMALDGTILGNCASEQMEALENDFGADDTLHVGTVITIVELQKREVNENGVEVAVGSLVRTRHNTPDLYRVVGILDQAKHDMLNL
jgi:hypothetical protein